MQQRKPKRPGLKREDIERGPRSVMGGPGAGPEMEVGQETARPEDPQLSPNGRARKEREKR